MAGTWTKAGETWNTTAGNKTVTATPAVNDLIVIVSMCSGVGNTQAITDDGAGGTYTEIGAADNTTDGTLGKRLRVWIRNNLVSSAVSTIYTLTATSDTGGGLTVMRLAGVTKTGSSASKQKAALSSQTAGTTPTPVLGTAATTTNSMIGAVVNATSPATLTPRSSPAYTEATDAGWSTPTAGIEVMHLNSGETATSIAWGGTSATAYGVFILEVDTSSASEPIETFAGQPAGDWYIGEINQDTPETDGYFAQDLHATAIEVPVVLIPPPDAFDLTEAAQEIQSEAYQHDSGQQAEYWGNVYGFPDPALEVIAQLFPPVAAEPIETFAAQPHYGDIQLDPEEHVDTPLLEGIEGYLSPNDAFDTTIATQPLAEQPWFPADDIDTELANDSTLDVTPQFFPPAAADDSYIATVDAPQHPFHDEEEPLYQPYVEQNEWLIAGPEDPIERTIAAQPLAEFPDFPDDLSQFDTPYVEQNEGFIAGPPLFVADAEGAAATQVFEQDIVANFPDPDPTNDQPLVDGAVEALQSPNDSTDTTTAATWFLPEHPEPESEFIPDAAVDQAEGFFTITADDGYIATLYAPDQQIDPEGFEPAPLVDDPAPFLSIPIVQPDPTLAAATELPGLGEFIPLDEEPVQPRLFEFWHLFPPSETPPITKTALWFPTNRQPALWHPIISKRVLWRPVLNHNITHEPIITKKASWDPNHDGQGSVP